MLEEKGLFVGDLGEQRRHMQDVVGRIGSDMRLLEEKGRNMVARLSEMRGTLSGSEHQRRRAVEELEDVERQLDEVRAAADRPPKDVTALRRQASCTPAASSWTILSPSSTASSATRSARLTAPRWSWPRSANRSPTPSSRIPCTPRAWSRSRENNEISTSRWSAVDRAEEVEDLLRTAREAQTRRNSPSSRARRPRGVAATSEAREREAPRFAPSSQA